MIDRFRGWLQTHPYAKWIYAVCLILLVILFAVVQIVGRGYIWLYITLAAIFVYAFRPNSALHGLTLENKNLSKTVCSVLVAAATIAVCVLPMDQLPLWNGEDPGHRNQYELMAEAILDGRIDFAYGDEDSLAHLASLRYPKLAHP